MKWDDTIRVTDVAIIFATLVGPVLAIQVQVWLEKRRARIHRRIRVFQTLMQNRASQLARENVHALNSIPIEFYDVKKITDAYKAYVAHTYVPQTNPAAWGEKRADLMTDLLQKIAVNLGYEFDVAQLKSEFYAPTGHFTMEAEQDVIRQGLARVFSGQAAIPMEVIKMPADPEVAAAMKALIKGDAALKVETRPAPPPPTPAIPPP